MRIGFFGHGPWAYKSLDLLMRDGGYEIACLASRTEGDPGMAPYAERLGLSLEVPPKINAPEFRDRLEGLDLDVLVSMSYDQIFGPEILKLPRLGAINCHAGALPRYRGRNVLNWAIINGEDRIGVTVHMIDENIDTGAILRQAFIEIGPEDTYREALEQARSQCATLLVAALDDLRSGTAKPAAQSLSGSQGFYCGRRRPGDEWLNWTWPSARIHNFVRGIALPGPCARTRWPGGTMAVLRTRAIPEAPCYIGTPGEIVGRGPDGVVVKTGDSTLCVEKMAPLKGDEELSEGDFVTPSFPIGTRFDPVVSPQIVALENRIVSLEGEIDKLRSS